MTKYYYDAKVLDIYDGDSLTLDIDCGFDIHLIEKCRLKGIDTPEIRTKNLKEKELGYQVRDYMRDLLLNKHVQVITTKEGKFGRYLVDLYYDKRNINKELVEKGYAKVYNGGKREKWNI